MTSIFRYYFFVLAAILLLGCNQEKSVNLSGTIDYVGSSEIYISKQPTHYKYSPKIRFPISVLEGNFDLSIPIDSTQIIEFHIDDNSYPIVAKPGRNLNLNISRTQFPRFIEVLNYDTPWDSLYANYYDQDQQILKKVDEQLPEFREGDATSILELYKKRYKLAQHFFEDTPLDVVYYKAVGEYLVKRLEEIKYRRGSGINPEKERQKVLKEAKDLNFFSFKLLHAQRAGIRDFTNAFANTFGVADSLEQKFGQELTQYDVKRFGYQTLDSARTSVLQYIEERKAQAYARMFLVAERIGEMPLDVATPSYNQFLEEYSNFPQYTSFLETFYQQIESVSPGNPAVPFTLLNKNEQPVQMKDFSGKYVLLDFWASWCIPCLDEFGHMEKLYKDFSRDQFEIVAISIEKDSLRWRQSLQQFDNPWPQLYGGNGFQQETFQTYRGGGIPFYILIGPDGNILRYNDIRPSFNLPTLLDSLITQSN